MMMETIKGLSYVEGFLTSMAAAMQDKEWTDGKPGNIAPEAHDAVRKLRNAEAFIKGQENLIEDLREELSRVTMMEPANDVVTKRFDRAENAGL